MLSPIAVSERAIQLYPRACERINRALLQMTTKRPPSVLRIIFWRSVNCVRERVGFVCETHHSRTRWNYDYLHLRYSPFMNWPIRETLAHNQWQIRQFSMKEKIPLFWSILWTLVYNHQLTNQNLKRFSRAKASNGSDILQNILHHQAQTGNA